LQTQEGKPNEVKTHLLRHAFATEAVQFSAKSYRYNRDIATFIINQIKNYKYVHKGPFISN
jgi:site-specific recombinase XerD